MKQRALLLPLLFMLSCSNPLEPIEPITLVCKEVSKVLGDDTPPIRRIPCELIEKP